MNAQKWLLAGHWPRLDEGLATLALVFMASIPLLEMVLRPILGSGIHNAPLLVQHLGLLLAMFGVVAAERGGHLSSLGAGLSSASHPQLRAVATYASFAGTAFLCGQLTAASGLFVSSEIDAGKTLAYGLPIWLIQAAMPLGFLWLGVRFAQRGTNLLAKTVGPLAYLFHTLPWLGIWSVFWLEGTPLTLWPIVISLLLLLLCGAPIFAILGGLALALFWQEGQPLAAVPLSHYQITVNPSLPALPLFTLAGLMFARSGAARRLGDLFTACSGGGVTGTAIAAAVLCSFFTAFTGGSGVTILALGGLLLPLLTEAGFPRQKGIGLVTSASALGVLLAPSVPLLMYAIMARVPINEMFIAGILPAVVMVGFLLLVGGYLKTGKRLDTPHARIPLNRSNILTKIRAAGWELAAPFVAIGALVSGLATPTESAALTAAYALITQTLIHRELDIRALRRCLLECVQVIGGVMLILGMALALTNYLVDAGIPDAAVEWVQAAIPNKWVFMIALNLFLLLAGALMEIFAAIVVLVPLLLPVALSYGIDPIHFGIIFLANMEMGFLCPPAGMNLYFASAMFGLPVHKVARSVLPALLALLLGSLTISILPVLSTWHLRY